MSLKRWEVSSLFRHPRPQRKRVTRSLVPQVEELEQRTLLSTFTVEGDVEWDQTVDQTTGAFREHPAPLVTVEIHKELPDYSDGGILATGTTSLVGKYSIVVDTGAGHEDTKFSIKVLSRSVIADVKNAAGDQTRSIDGLAGQVAADGAIITGRNIIAHDTDLNGQSFCVNNAFVMIAQYCGNLTGWIPSTIDVRFDSTIAGSDFSPGTKVIRIRGGAWDEWDEIQHEFGHYVAAQFAFDDSPGGTHYLDANLWEARGDKDEGIRLAWSEGWATFFGISGQKSMGASALHIPTVGDTAYQSYNNQINLDLETGARYGEDNEQSVWAILWDLWDRNVDGNDHVSMNDAQLFYYMNTYKPKTLGEAWEALAGTRNAEERAKMGAVFAQNGVAPKLMSPGDNFSPGSAIPTFSWVKQGAGPFHPNNDFRIQFFDNDFSSIVFEKDLGDVDHWQPTAEEWTRLNAENIALKWVVEGRNLATPETPGGANGIGYYWSEARTLPAQSIVLVIDDTESMVGEIGSVKSALLDYIDLVDVRLPIDAKPPTITLITFKDDVTVRVTSNDLKVIRDAVSGLSASGGGDCPEASAEALAVAASMVSAGGTVLLATDASTHPGTDMASVIAQLRAKGVTFNPILLGDCGTITFPSISSAAASPAFESSASTGAPDEHAVDGDCNDSDGTCHCNDPAISSTSQSVVGAEMSPGVEQAPDPDGATDGATSEYTSDPGQAPIDDYGNGIADASPLAVGDPLREGVIGRGSDYRDFFKIELVAGTKYLVTATSTSRNDLQLDVFESTGTYKVAYTAYIYNSTGTVEFTPETTGTYYVVTTAWFATSAVPYELQVTEAPEAPVGDGGPLASTSSVVLYSTVAAETGGTFLVRDAYDGGSLDAAIFNMLASTLGPAVLSATPDLVAAGETVALTLTARGTHWVPGQTTVSFGDPGLVVQSVQVTSANTLTATVRIAGTVDPDLYDVTVETSLGSDTETARGVNALFVTEPVTYPTILGTNPHTVSQGSTGNLIIRGSNLDWTTSDFTVDLGVGMTVNSIHVDSPTRLTVNYTAAVDAPIGYRSVIVTQPGHPVAQMYREIFVAPAAVEIPQIVGLSAGNALPGTTLILTVTGANTHFVDGITEAYLGNGIYIVSVTVTSPTSAIVNIAIDADATAGYRDVILRTYEETVVLFSGFLVGEVVPDGPEIVEVATDNGLPGEILSLTVTGANTHFVNGITTASLGAGINVTSVTVTSPTSATVNIAVNAAASLGLRDVVLMTNAESATLPSGFLVGEPIPVVPYIGSSSPDYGLSGQSYSLTVTGVHTHFVNGVTTASLGAGITVTGVTVTSRTSAVVNITVDTSALTGDRDVVLQTNGETVSLPEGFYVFGVMTDPTIIYISPTSAPAGQLAIVHVTGRNTNFVNGVTTASLGEGINVLGVTVSSATSVNVSISIDANATVGPRILALQTGSETLSVTNGFQVLEAGSGDPRIDSISASTALPGTSLSMTITGLNTHFVNGVTTASFGAGINVTSVVVTSATSATVHITINTVATLGPRNVVLRTGSEVVVKTAGFSVVSETGDDNNVTVSVGNKTLTITGDAIANHLLITIIDTKTIRVEGQDGTTINGKTGPQNFAAKSVAIVNLGAGDDDLRVVSNRANAIRKTAAINMGAGDDYLRLENLTIKGRARLTLGSGKDFLSLLDTVFSKSTTSDFNEAEDTLEQSASASATIAAKERSSKHAGKSIHKGRGKSS